MKITKCFKHAFNMVLHSRLRSWLTILGIVIGVAAVIAIVSISAGMEQSMSQQLGGLGGDILTLTAGYSRGTDAGRPPGGFTTGGSGSATEEAIVVDRTDVQALKSIPDIKLIDTRISGRVNVSYLGKSGTVSLTGVDQKVWAEITTDEIRDGRMLDSADQNVVVIGSRLADSYFDQVLGINKMFMIEGNAFRVVGILDEGNTNIYAPIQMAYQMLDDKEQGVYDSIVIQVKDEEMLDDTIAKIEKKLMTIRHVTNSSRDFSISSSKQMMETRQEMMESMSLFLTAIAAVSLLVGAVGIANTMFTSVLEKTKEIGIMKAIGARNKDILLIFLLNSGLIGLVGGALGVMSGALISSIAIPYLTSGIRMAGRMSVTTLVSVDAVIAALGVSLIVGIIAGIVPAYQGSKLKPVDALRYE